MDGVCKDSIDKWYPIYDCMYDVQLFFQQSLCLVPLRIPRCILWNLYGSMDDVLWEEKNNSVLIVTFH